MKTLRKIIQEMTHNTGINNNNRNKIDNWNFYNTKGRKFIELIKDKLGSQHFKIYRTFDGKIGMYFLVSENEEYKGHINYTQKGKTIHILESSKEKDVKYFYQIMFTVLLLHHHEILSDSKLSKQAVKSYIKIANSIANQQINIKVKLHNKYLEPTEENIYKTGALFSVRKTSKDDNSIEETFKEFNERYSYIGILGHRYSWGRLYDEKNKDIDRILFLVE